jgi:hypothetical protein
MDYLSFHSAFRNHGRGVDNFNSDAGLRYKSLAAALEESNLVKGAGKGLLGVPLSYGQSNNDHRAQQKPVVANSDWNKLQTERPSPSLHHIIQGPTTVNTAMKGTRNRESVRFPKRGFPTRVTKPASRVGSSYNETSVANTPTRDKGPASFPEASRSKCPTFSLKLIKANYTISQDHTSGASTQKSKLLSELGRKENSSWHFKQPGDGPSTTKEHHQTQQHFASEGYFQEHKETKRKKARLDDSHLPKGDCRYILLHPAVKGLRCACVGFALNWIIPGSTCDCGHHACYHSPDSTAKYTNFYDLLGVSESYFP